MNFWSLAVLADGAISWHILRSDLSWNLVVDGAVLMSSISVNLYDKVIRKILASYGTPGAGADAGSAVAVVPAGVDDGLVGGLVGASDPRAAFILSMLCNHWPNALYLVEKVPKWGELAAYTAAVYGEILPRPVFDPFCYICSKQVIRYKFLPG